ncbi:hypothetical protein D0862_10167 [Hortaea werneckii]|uniref:FAD-binding domain-containing protein n=1 Tax=Hortaea werneckii TaxID=91943 RepID=A0A3M7FLV5_HORWE|nr:hypothetical protein D0862_10167 [Hortaea werneckii]
MPRETSSHIAIVGGGLCGLSLAIALKARGIPFRIYETRSSFTELGAGINIGPNTLRTFQLIDPSLYQALEKIWCRNPPGQEDVWMQIRLGAPSGKYDDAHLVTELMAPPTGNVTVQRNALLQILAERVGQGNAVFDKKFVNYRCDGDGVILSFADGTEERASAVIACDGIHSAVRQAMLDPKDPAANPQYAGVGVYRGIVATEDLSIAIGPQMARTSQLFLGPGAYVIMYPVDYGKKVNIRLWPWRKGPWEDKQNWTQLRQRQPMLEQFEAWGETIHKIMDLMDDPPFFATHYHSIPPTSYHDIRACLIGDAAHAMTPHQGAGAGQAMEDAFVMAEVLERVDREHPTSQQIAAAFAAYEAVRRPRAEKFLETSQAAMSFWTGFYERPLSSERLQQFVEDANQRFHWIWHYDIARQGIDAVQAMKISSGPDAWVRKSDQVER